jgi:hypothetical protein
MKENGVYKKKKKKKKKIPMGSSGQIAQTAKLS